MHAWWCIFRNIYIHVCQRYLQCMHHDFEHIELPAKLPDYFLRSNTRTSITTHSYMYIYMYIRGTSNACMMMHIHTYTYTYMSEIPLMIECMHHDTCIRRDTPLIYICNNKRESSKRNYYIISLKVIIKANHHYAS